MLVSPKTMLNKARKGNYAIPAFNINNMEILQAVIEAAVDEMSPVIVQTSEGAINYAGMEYLSAMVHVASKLNKIPIAFHLDHGKDKELVKRAIDSGFYTSVMYDGSHLSFEENVKTTKSMVMLAHKKNPKIYVEAELGAIPGREDLVRVSRRDSFYTDPEQAKEFVKRTGCDSLAISIGTAHGAFKFSKSPYLDFDRLQQIKKSVSVPLVLHGASEVDRLLVKTANSFGARLGGVKGVSNRLLSHAVKLGINKVNIDTDLRIAFDAGVRKFLKQHPKVFDPRKILEPAKDLIKKEAKEKMKLLGSSGKA